MFLPESIPEFAEGVAQRIRNNAYRSLFPAGDRLQRITVSVGAASYPQDGPSADDVVTAAEARMYRDKDLRRQKATAGTSGAP